MSVLALEKFGFRIVFVPYLGRFDTNSCTIEKPSPFTVAHNI